MVSPGAPGAASPAPAPSSAVPLPAQSTPPQTELTPGAVPEATPTQPPIVVDPSSASVALGGTVRLHVLQVAGTVTAVAADPTVADVLIEQDTRTLVVTGRKLGNTVVTVSDSRGLTRDVPIRVLLPAGSVADAANVRITGRPATELFVKEQAVQAALRRASARPGRRSSPRPTTWCSTGRWPSTGS